MSLTLVHWLRHGVRRAFQPLPAALSATRPNPMNESGSLRLALFQSCFLNSKILTSAPNFLPKRPPRCAGSAPDGPKQAPRVAQAPPCPSGFRASGFRNKGLQWGCFRTLKSVKRGNATALAVQGTAQVLPLNISKHLSGLCMPRWRCEPSYGACARAAEEKAGPAVPVLGLHRCAFAGLAPAT